MTYDGTDPDDDGTVEADVDNESVSTGQVKFDQGYSTEEDDNSPFTGSGSQSYTYQLSNNFDHIILKFDHIINTSGSTQDIEMLVDDANNYDYILTGNTSQTTGQSELPLCANVDNTVELAGDIFIDGRQSLTRAGVRSDMSLTDLNQSDLLEAGEARGTSSPIDSITLRGASGNIDFQARVIGISL